LSPSQKRPVATVWHVSDDGKISSVYSVEKDLFQNKTLAEAFLHGMIHFPAGEANANDTYFHGVALRGIDNRTLRLFHD
jgi:hypothetical protein